ncbi:MAG: zinc-dependent metalloprotease [Longimicrobiaceae bacterium]
MIRRLAGAAAVALSLALSPPPAEAQQPLPSIAEKTRGMERKDGFIPLYWDAQGGKLWMELPPMGQGLIYQVSLPAGMGSNDIGLDRGQLGDTRLVRFERSGPRVLMVQPNQNFRAVTTDPDERRDVETSFAQSVLWGFTVAAESEGRVLVDATDFALRDVHGVVPALRRARQGDFRLDPTRSAFYLPNLKAFPRNSEIEVTLTFTGDNPGNWVRDVTPTPEAITVRERHSFVRLPEPGYVPRRSDPRGGFFGIEYADYATPIGQPLQQRFISRHRLRKRDPAAAVSEPVEPIVYYVDRAAPEPVRTALLEGARWWNQAFEAAGYRNAFRVELLPEGADPMDVRYNVIQYVHRATRGWSYGASVVDPRTGEIIKGHVTLGSLRARQDWLIAEGLLAPYARGDEDPPEVRRMVLARLRQLAAHEVGHTLGLAHNYIASTEGRASVMDYPHPLVKLTADGRIDLSDAYPEGIGAWDKVAISWGYADLPSGEQPAPLERILTDARARGLVFLTDQDARPTGSAHPQTHLWDNGTDAAAELARVMQVRRAALNRFGETAIRAGMPLATMEEALVPLYLHHRYQAEAATKLIAGQWYAYNLRGDGQDAPRAVPAADQRRALAEVLKTVSPDELALPKGVLDRLPPRPFTYDPHRELFTRYTGLVFDAVSPAASAADMTFGLLFDPQRAARLVEQHALDRSLPDLDEVLEHTQQAVFANPGPDPYRREVARAVQRSMVERLMDLAANASMPQVRAVAAQRLRLLRTGLRGAPLDPARNAHERLLAEDIARFLDRPWEPRERREPLAPPPGSPIGDEDY